MTQSKHLDTTGFAAVVDDAAIERQALLDEIISTTMQTLHAEVCSIFLQDEENDPGFLKCVAGSGFASKIVGVARYEIGEGFTGSVARFGGEYNIRTREELENIQIGGDRVWRGKFDGKQWLSANSEFRNLLALRLPSKGRTLGVIKAENKISRYGDHFTNDDLLMFRTIANVISLALENARLNQDREEQSRRVSTALAQIVSAVVGRYDMDALVNQIINTTVRILNAEVCSIFLEDRDVEPGVLKCVAGSGFASKIVGIAKYKIGEGFTGSVAKFGGEYNIRSREQLQSIQIGGQSVWRGKFDDKQWESSSSEFRNLLALPLTVKSQTIGVIKVENKIGGDFFTTEDETIFKIIANAIALTIEKTRLQLQIEDQLKTISAMAAHRINNQMTRYDGIIFKLRRLIQSNKATRDELRTIEHELSEATDHIKKMVSEFRKYGKPAQLDMRPSNINKIIIDEIWYAQPPDGILITPDLDRSIPDVDLDTTRFPESIKELLGNAIRSIGKHKGSGSILVTTRLTSNEAAEPGVLITIDDDGPGFPQSFPVFSPFQTTDPQHTGLGLATVKETMEAHGGTIRLVEKSEPGALLELFFPLNRGGK